jgi:methionyl-tRNA formyltransferase
VFFGSGGFAVAILDALAGIPDVAVVGVVTAPDRPSGRRGEPTPVPVARRARDYGLPIHQPVRLRAAESVAAVADLRPEFGVLADYGQIVPRAILELPPRHILNVHPSALPRHRGATPIPATILAGDPEAAVTLIRMDEGLDTGPIVAQRRWALDGTETAETLEAAAATLGARLLRETVGPWLAGRLAEQAQDDAAATLTRPLTREDGRLDPMRPAVELERWVRAHVPWPGSFIDTPQGRLIVHRAVVAPRVAGDTPGAIVADGDGIALATTDGRLRVLEAQLAGRRQMDSAALRRGSPGLVGLTVGLR